MAAGIYNFTIEQGTTVVKQFTYKDASDTVVDLTGYDVRMQMRDTVASTTVIDTFTTGSNNGMTIIGTVSSSTSGTIQLRIEASDTNNYTFNTAVYDIEIENTGSQTVTRLLQGSIKLSPQVTR